VKKSASQFLYEYGLVAGGAALGSLIALPWWIWAYIALGWIVLSVGVWLYETRDDDET